MFTQNYMQEQSRLSLFLSVFLPHSSAVILPPSTRCASLLSFALQVVALRLTPLLAVEAGQRLPILVHTPAVSPPPAFGWTALQRETKENRKNKRKMVTGAACLLSSNKFAVQRLMCAPFITKGLRRPVAPVRHRLWLPSLVQSQKESRGGLITLRHTENRLTFPRWGIITLTQLQHRLQSACAHCNNTQSNLSVGV